MQNKILSAVMAFFVAAVMAGCGGNSSMMLPSAQTASVTVTMTDAPPAGVTVLSFEVNVNSATLNPGTTPDSSSVPLLAKPVEIEVKQLETESAFLSAANVPAGTYKSISFSLMNPELTILNQSNATIGSCVNGAVCEFKPSGGNVTFSSAPFPVTLQAGSPTGFRLDVNLANLITNSLTLDFTAAGAINITQFSLPNQMEEAAEELNDLRGVIQNLDAMHNKFDLVTSQGTFTITTNSNTEFELEDMTCAAMPANFSCLANGQVVEVDVAMMAGSVFLAKKIEIEEQQEVDEVEGVVFKIDSATQFELVVLDEEGNITNVSLGNPVVITLQSGATFQVDTDGLNVPSGLLSAFQGATDTSQLMPGQVVQVRARSVMAGPPITVATDRVRLRMSQFTAQVSGAPASPNFSLGNLPAIFTNNGVTSVQVQTSSATEFENVAGVSSLADGNMVSVRGLLFKNAGSPPAILIAAKVRLRGVMGN